MKKKDLRNGAVVKIRNGEKFLKIDNTLLMLRDLSDYLELSDYSDDLRDKEDSYYDIVAVHNEPYNSNGFLNRSLSETHLNNWTWERKEEPKRRYFRVKSLSFNIRPQHQVKVGDIGVYVKTDKKYMSILLNNPYWKGHNSMDDLPKEFMNERNLWFEKEDLEEITGDSNE